ncbi:UDP-glucose 4-epimerase GalE [Simkania negevensis]|uniref:UDP-glucose 4-epimerase n=1 Tax=Simkania negevensis TaxID=83561 RepID=A0ABS3AR70_9BACT|nr:UDP-glucose 4-epimerase GalE [Simkania negevensis]
MKKILITGGAGYIGSLINKMLAERGYDTVVYDNLSISERDSVVRGRFVQGDISDTKKLDKLFTDHFFDGVFHFAASIRVEESMENPQKYYNNNVANTLRLLDVMIRHNVNILVFSSTAAVYGVPEKGALLKESDPLNPISPYGRSKLFIEQILTDYADAYGLKFCALRYFNAAGGDPDGEVRYTSLQNLIPIALNTFRKNRASFNLYGIDYPTADGTCVRDYIHTYDIGTAHILGFEALLDGASSLVYNLGNSQGFSNREILHMIEKVTGKQLNIIEAARRKGDPPILRADATKIRKELSWAPQYSEIETIIAHAWKALK